MIYYLVRGFPVMTGGRQCDGLVHPRLEEAEELWELLHSRRLAWHRAYHDFLHLHILVTTWFALYAIVNDH